MGLMGYVRSGLREDWHVYGALRDTSDWAWTPTNAVMARVVGGIVVAFLAIVAAMFWLANIHTPERSALDGKVAGLDKP
jgi:hypothetical protein